MRLYYFDTPGRAEFARIMFILGEVKFEDVHIPEDEWLEYRQKSPTRQAPFLVLDDGTTICQSAAISVFAAELAGLWPSDQVKRARSLELIATCESVRFHPLRMGRELVHRALS